MAPDDYGSKIQVVGMDMIAPKNRPIGSYDDSILCDDCDRDILGKYDEYALNFITQAKLSPHPSGPGWVATGCDQRLLKLFIISYIWRASISSLDEFVGVNLGQTHEMKIRDMIWSQDAGGIEDYSVSLARFDDTDTAFGGLLFPARTRIKGVTYYEGYLPRLYKFWMKVDRRSDPLISSLSLGAGSDLFINSRGSFQNSDEIRIMAKTVQGKPRKNPA